MDIVEISMRDGHWVSIAPDMVARNDARLYIKMSMLYRGHSIPRNLHSQSHSICEDASSGLACVVSFHLPG